MDNGLLNTFIEFTSADAPSLGERRVADLLLDRLKSLGAQPCEDGAGSVIGGDCGNIYAYIEGNTEEPPVLFSAHLDTVEPSRGKSPIVTEDPERGIIIKAGGGAVLGADDISGVAVILAALESVLKSGRPRRPIELLFTVAEEIYGKGAAAFDYSRLKSKEGYTLDLGGEIGDCAVSAPTILSFNIEIKGKAAHAGFCPGEGVNALAAACAAVARLPQGALKDGLTRNFGRIEGGAQTNIVCGSVLIKGEIRALNDGDATIAYNETLSAFQDESEKIGASLSQNSRREIIAYKTDINANCVRRFARCCERAGAAFNPLSTMGGSDHNEFARHGVEGVVIACSMHNVHTTGEYAVLSEMEMCADIIGRLMSADIDI